MKLKGRRGGGLALCPADLKLFLSTVTEGKEPPHALIQDKSINHSGDQSQSTSLRYDYAHSGVLGPLGTLNPE